MKRNILPAEEKQDAVTGVKLVVGYLGVVLMMIGVILSRDVFNQGQAGRRAFGQGFVRACRLYVDHHHSGKRGAFFALRRV